MERYTSPDEDSARWEQVPLRAGDIIVSTRSKHGTTWVQAVLLMLVHGPDLPDALPELASWVDHLVDPIEELVVRLDAQDHRRVLKTHTPLDGVPTAPGVHRVVVARHPLDAALSLYHQSGNIDRQRLAEATGNPVSPPTTRLDAAAALRRWTRTRCAPEESMDSLDGVAHHLQDAWDRRDEARVVLIHYADLLDDLRGQVLRLARATDLEVTALDEVVSAAGFDAMRARADHFVPDVAGVLMDHEGFFRRGRSGEARALLDDAVHASYRTRMAELLTPDLDAWLHR